MSIAPVVLEKVMGRDPTLGPHRLLCVDGPAGSGKTTLAGAVATLHGSASVVHLDDLYHGWEGLRRAPTSVEHNVVKPLAAGQAGRFRRFDWLAMEPAEWVEVPPADLVVIEGCGSGASAYSGSTTLLVWVEAPPEECLRRGLERDGDHLRDRWLVWQADEAELFARERTRERADVLVDGTTGRLLSPGRGSSSRTGAPW